MPQPPISIHGFFTFGRCFAAEIHFEARLGVSEIVRTKTRLRVLAEQRREDVVEQRLQVAHRDVLVDVQALELVEVRAVRRIGRVAAINAPGRDDADRRLDLSASCGFAPTTCACGAGISPRGVFLVTLPKRARVREIKRVLRIARRMIGGRVERIETVVLGFNFRAVRDGEADFAQDPAHLFPHERQRMIGARPSIRRRQCGVNRRSELRRKLDASQSAQAPHRAAC